MQGDQFGAVVFDKKSLIEEVVKVSGRGYSISNAQKMGEKYFVNFVDQQNCARIFGEIESAMKPLVQ